MSTESTTTQNTTESTTQSDLAAPEATAATTDTTATTEGAQETQEVEGSNAEAAKYRVKLRETEAERDTLTTQLQAMQRAEVERQAGAELKNPAGLWSAGVQLGDLLTEDGTIDPEKVTAAALQARDDIGLASPMTRQNVAPKEGTNPEPFGSRESWEDVISGHADGSDW